jgi:hypothetical protein
VGWHGLCRTCMFRTCSVHFEADFGCWSEGIFEKIRVVDSISPRSATAVLISADRCDKLALSTFDEEGELPHAHKCADREPARFAASLRVH